MNGFFVQSSSDDDAVCAGNSTAPPPRTRESKCATALFNPSSVCCRSSIGCPSSDAEQARQNQLSVRTSLRTRWHESTVPTGILFPSHHCTDYAQSTLGQLRGRVARRGYARSPPRVAGRRARRRCYWVLLRHGMERSPRPVVLGAAGSGGAGGTGDVGTGSGGAGAFTGRQLAVQALAACAAPEPVAAG